MTSERAKAARDLLAFYAEAGVDAALGEHANAWLAENGADAFPQVTSPLAGEIAERGEAGGNPPAQVARAPAQAAMSPPVAPPLPPDAAVMTAREAARSAASLDALRDILDRFEGCALKTTAS